MHYTLLNELLVETMFGQSLVTPPRADRPGGPALELINLGVGAGRVYVQWAESAGAPG